MANWLLPDHMADMLPRQSMELESMRRSALSLMLSHGFELIRPPMFEFLESLLTGSGSRLDKKTIKFVDEASGKQVGFRADITPQAARIDAHILNRPGITRLCYAGSVLHARARHPLASRQPYVIGAELFGARGREADLEMLRLAVDALREVGVRRVHLVIGHTEIVRLVLGTIPSLTEDLQWEIVSALADKDSAGLEALRGPVPEEAVETLERLSRIYGGSDAAPRLVDACCGIPGALEAAKELEWLASRCGADDVTIDGAAVNGFDYHTGISFSGICEGISDPVLKGGRYDGIGFSYGRFRPAVGFTLYVRDLAVTRNRELPAALVAPAADDKALEKLLKKLRSEGNVVVQLLPGEDPADLDESFRVVGRVFFEKGQWRVEAPGPGTNDRGQNG